MEAAIWGLLGTAVGALASLGATWLTGRHALERQSQAKSLDRIEQGRAFQRANLIALQDALHDGMRIVTRMHLEDLAAFRKGGEWGRTSLSDEVNEGVRLSQRNIMILVERIANDELREDLKKVLASTNDVVGARSQRDGQAALEAATTHGLKVMEHIGRVLRSLY